MSQRSFNFFSVPAASSSNQNNTQKKNTNSSNTSTSSTTGSNSNRATTPGGTSTQKRPFSGKSETEPISKTNQGKTSKFFAQKQTTLTASSISTTGDGSSGSSNLITPSSKRSRVVKMQRKDGKIVQDCEVYIGRAVTKGGWNLPHSKWGNPYPVSTCGGSAEVACQKYRDYILRRDDLLQDLDELDGKVLGCWCKVDASCHCHGDTLVELLDMKHKGELDEYIKNYLQRHPEPLYPVPSRGKKN